MVHPLLQRARREGTPLLTRESATFIWHGQEAPRLIGDMNDWEQDRSLALERLAPGLWAKTLPFPADAYVEYAYLAGQERTPDPLNPRATPNGLGAINQFFYMPDGAPTSLVRRRRGIPRGTMTRYTLPTLQLAVGAQRTVYLYQPPVQEPCPLLVVLDGADYWRRAHLPTIVENLVAGGQMRPIALAMVQNGGKARGIEYGCCDATVGFLSEVVFPLAQEHLRLVDGREKPGVHGLIGASMGGLAALYTALRTPELFGLVLSQSGAFGWGEHRFVVSEMLRYGPSRAIRVWMDVGRLEGLLGVNQEMHALLQTRGYQVAYHEYNAGHNYPAWRNDVAHGLTWLYGPDSCTAA
jgi:enterochelin esterase-like enzyme